MNDSILALWVVVSMSCRQGQCLSLCGHVCAATSPYLLYPGHSANILSKEPLVVIQGVTRPGEEKRKPMRRGGREGKREEQWQWLTEANNPPRYPSGVPLSLLIHFSLSA